MKFCIKCGRQVNEGERFCVCGSVLNDENIVSRRQFAEKDITDGSEFNPDLILCEQDMEGIVINGYRIIKEIFNIFGHYYYQAVKADSEAVIEHITISEDSFSDFYYMNCGMNNDSVADMLDKFAEQYLKNITDNSDKKFLYECFSMKSELNRTIHIISIYKKSKPICSLKSGYALLGLKLMELEENFRETISDINVWIDDEENLYAVPFATEIKQNYFIITPDILYMKSFQSDKKYYSSGIILIRLMNGHCMPFVSCNDFNMNSFSRNEKRRRSKSFPAVSYNMNNPVWKAAELMIFSENPDCKNIISLILNNSDKGVCK